MGKHLTELKDLLILNIPEPKELEDGFLEIINKSHYENINSQVYAYFLDPSNNVVLAELFLSSLMEVIKNQTEETDRQEGKARKEEEEILTLEDYEVITELGVLQQDKVSKARIDICLHDETGKKAIIIENKIYHTLINPLKDYWNHFDYPDENKLGIVLTLHNETIPKEMKTKFVNITHAQWIAQIKQNGLPSGLSPKHYIYLNDFFQTITNLTNEAIMDDSVKFYFEHTSKIEKAINTKESAFNYVISQLQTASQALGLPLTGSSKVYRYLWEQDKLTGYTILLHDLFNEKRQIYIVIESTGKDMEKLKNEKDIDLGSPDGFSFSDQDRGGYMHCVIRSYKLSSEQIKGLSKFLVDKITHDFDPILSRIYDVLDKSKKLNE